MVLIQLLQHWLPQVKEDCLQSARSLAPGNTVLVQRREIPSNPDTKVSPGDAFEHAPTIY